MKNNISEIQVLSKILLDDNVEKSIKENEDIIFEIIPMLKFEKDFEQKSEWHCYDVWNHTIKAISKSPMDFEIRLVLLLHDIGKPFSYQEDGNLRHFKNHALKSQEISKSILENLGYKDEELNEMLFLIGTHATSIDCEMITKENIDLYKKLIDIQICDGSAYEPNHAKKIIEKLIKTKQEMEKRKVKYLRKKV